MHKTHPVFEAPQNPHARIWRYQDFAKLVSLLTTGSLFFSRVDLLQDIYEGSLPVANVDLRRAELIPILTSGPQFARAAKNCWGIELSSEEADALVQRSALHMENYQIQENLSYRRFTCINCWHMNEEESYAMWRLYCQAQEAIAVQSSYERLVECLAECPEDIYVGGVKYTNYDSEPIPTGNDFYRFMYKRSSFSHECELRAVIQRNPPMKPDPSDAKGQTQVVDWAVDLFPDGGIPIPVKLNALVERIVLSPTAAPWFEHAVRSVVEKYGFSFPVARSALARAPHF